MPFYYQVTCLIYVRCVITLEVWDSQVRRIAQVLSKSDLVWYYLDPIPEQPKIKDLLACYNEKIGIYVDGELETKPKTLWS
jgi:hypothetical protein